MNAISRVSLSPPYRPSPSGELLVTAVNAGCLWWFTWVQFMTVQFFGLPHSGGGRSSVVSLAYYEPAGDLPWSLPNLFFVLSMGLVAFCLSATCREVWAKPGGLRMTAVVVIFSVILLGFSNHVRIGRQWHIESLEWYIGVEDERGGDWYQGGWEEERRFLQETIDGHRRDMGLD